MRKKYFKRDGEPLLTEKEMMPNRRNDFVGRRIRQGKEVTGRVQGQRADR